MRTADHQSVAQEVQQSGTLGRGRGRVAPREVAIGLVQEIAGIRFLIETPDKKALGPRKVTGPGQLVQEAGRDRRLAGSAEPDQREHPTDRGLPRGAQHLELGLPPHELGSRRQWMDQSVLRGM